MAAGKPFSTADTSRADVAGKTKHEWEKHNVQRELSNLIQKVVDAGLYATRDAFVQEAVRLRLEQLGLLRPELERERAHKK